MKFNEEVDIFKGSVYFSKFLNSFYTNEKIELKNNLVSRAIYYHICKMKYAGWKHRINFNRYKKHTISEFFQDVIAFYLNVTLPDDCIIELEKKTKKTQPDIAIRKGEKYIFLIEIKTNIGWERPDSNKADPFEDIKIRIDSLSKNFNIDQENIIYILEEHSNVSKEFSGTFWDSKEGKATKRPTDFPLNRIYPLFNATDPYYWKYEKGFNRTCAFKEFSDEEIYYASKNNIVTPFEDIIKRIRIVAEMSD